MLFLNKGAIISIYVVVIVINNILIYNILNTKADDQEKTVKTLSNMAYIDKLTKINNRRAAEEYFEQYFDLFLKHKKSIVTVVCDIDYFKKVNDTYGHDVGDKVLVRVARILDNSVRNNDVVCRWGGEEFVIIMPGLSENTSYSVLERLRNNIKKEVFTDGDKYFNITMSFGLSGMKVTDGSYERSFERADQALYFSKNNGRNQVTIYEKQEGEGV